MFYMKIGKITMGRNLIVYALLFFLQSIAFSGYSHSKSINSAGSDSDFDLIIKKVQKLIPIPTNHDSVTVLLDKAQQLADVSKKSHQAIQILLLRGQNEYYSSNYEKAIDIYYQALDQAELMHDSLILAKANLSLGLIYNEFEDYNESISFFQKTLKISNVIKDSSTLAKAYQDIASSYRHKKDHKTALEFDEKAMNLAVLLKDTCMIIDITNNLGTIAYDQGDLLKSLDYYQKALNLYHRINDQKGIALAYNNIGLVYMDQKDYKKSFEYLKKALALATELKMNDFVGDIYSNLTIYYHHLNDYKNAFYCYDRFNIIYDSLAGEKKNKMIYQIQAKYKLGKNTRELEELKHKNQMQLDAIDSARSIQVYLVIITVLVVLLMAATFFLLYKEKKLAAELKRKTQELSELNASKDKFFSIIAHDLKNPFNVLVSYTSLLKTDLDLFTREQLEQIIVDLNKASENGFNLLQNLLLWTRSQTNRIHVFKRNFLLTSVFSEVRELAELNLMDKEQALSIDVDPKLVVYADKDMISAVLRNLVFNAIKFSEKGAEIFMKASLTGLNVKIDVIDSGIGISEENIKKLFVIDKNVTTPGTDGEVGTGLGLVLCKEFIEKNDGTIWVESKLGEGSVFSIMLPIGKPVDNKS